MNALSHKLDLGNGVPLRPMLHFNPFPADPEISRPAAAMRQTLNTGKKILNRHQAVLTAKPTSANYISTNYS